MNAASASRPFPAVSLGLWPRHCAALAALLCVGGALWFLISQEVPVGRVEGRALLGESRKPLPNVKITLVAAEEPQTNADNPEGGGGQLRRFRAVTDASGLFQLARVPVGFYRLSAASKAHSTGETSVFVSEDEVSEVPLRLKRSQPDLQVTQQQTEFLTSENVVLPIHGYLDGQDQLGAKTVGLPASDLLRVRIFRTHLSQILRDPAAAKAYSTVGNRYSPISSLPVALLHPTSAQAPQLVASRAIAISGADIEGLFHQRLKLGALSAGLYLVDVKHGNRTVCAQMRVSDSALVVKKSRETLLTWTVDSQSGLPRAGALVQLFQAGKPLGQARSDAQGLARIALKANSSGSGAHLMTLSSHGADEAAVGQYDGRGDGEEGHGEFTVHAYTDRPIYRPGDVISFKGIARRTLDSGLRYAVPTSEKVALEVRAPSGDRVSQQNLVCNRFGSFHGTVSLSPEAPTGSYSLVMTLRGEEHTADFNVASYRKPEFSATVAPNQKHYSFGDNVEMMLDATYYFGAPVSGGKAHYYVYRAPDWASFYASDDDSESDNGDESASYADDSGEMVEEGDVTLDVNGHAIIRFAAQSASKTENSDEEGAPDPFSTEPQDQVYSVQVSVTDAAQREVEAGASVPVAAGDFRLSAQTAGYFAVPGQATAVTVAARDFDGHPIAGAPIELSSSYESWGENGALAAPRDAQTFTATTDAAGVATIQVTPRREGVLTLAAQTHDARNRAIVATKTLWIAGSEGGDYDAPYADLSLLTDKKHYRAGETARVLLNSEEENGTVLLSLEGSKLFKAWLVPLKHRSTAVEVPISADYGPNVTLVACRVRDKKFARSEAPLHVEVPQRQIRVAVQSDRPKYQPGDLATYHIQTADFAGKPVPAELSFGVVDEAIYALQEDDNLALRDAFYPQNPNSVETNYSFEPLYLGDVNKAEPNIEARRKFVDTAFWQSDLQTDASGKASVSFRLPDNLTTWRATAVAQTLDTAFGRRIQKTVVAKDFFVRLETPRFFTGGDQTQITALVHNETGSDQTATVKLEADGLALSGDATQTVPIAAGAVGQVVWPVSTDQAGLSFSQLAHFRLSSWTPKTASGTQFTDAVETTIPVRAHGRERIENFVGSIEPGASATHQLPFDAAAIPAASRVTVRITPSVADALVGGLRYLVGFPYGCTEQTMSRFLPDILVQRTLRIQSSTDPEAQSLRKKLPTMVRDGLARLSRFQHESGGWGWWEADDDDPWMTAYVLYGLSQARAEGYAVSDDMVERGRAAAAQMLKQKVTPIPVWQRSNWENTRAFLLYSLALSEPTPEQKTLILSQRAALSTRGLEAQALGYVVLLDKILGRSDASVGESAWPQLESQLQNEGDQLLFWKGSGYDEWADWNDKTATALGLQALISQNRSDSRIAPVLMWLMAHRENDTWGSTRDTAWILGALCAYLDSRPASATSNPSTVNVSLNGKTLENSAVAGGETVLRVPWQKLGAAKNSLIIKRGGGAQPLFYAVQVRQTIGSDAPLPALNSALPIKIEREYRRLVARKVGSTDSWTIQSEPTKNQLQQGDRIRVRLTFQVPKDLSYVLIEDAFPSGCEVTERGDAGEGNDEWDNWWSSTDVRDDRIAFFARHMTRGKHTIEYNLRAQTPGTYGAMPTLLQAMYAPDVRAEAPEDRVVIR